MPATTSQIQVRITKDRSEAALTLPGDFDRAQISTPALLGILQDAGIAVTVQVKKTLEEICRQPPAPGQNADLLIAQATPPRHGEDGRVNWLVDQHDTAASATQTAHANQNTESRSFYDQSAFVMVKQGQTIGQVIDPIEGEDGCDVTGKVIAAKQARQAAVTCDETIMRTAKGELIAQCDGVLVRLGDKAGIKQQLEIQGDVDFATGNIDFHGDVSIHGRICDRFVVRAVGNIEVGRLIEAATIDCGGNLIARAGIAGREIAQITVRGDVNTRYIDSATVTVHGDLHLDREAINAHLQITGQLLGEHATIIGGTTTVIAPAKIGSIGSDGGVETIIVAGRAPLLEKQAANLRQIIHQFTQRQQSLTQEQAQFSTRASANSASQKERQTEIMFELQGTTTSLAKAAAGLALLENQIQARRAVDITITRKLFRGCILAIRDKRYKAVDDIPGPLHILAEPDHHPRLIRGSSDPQPLPQCPALRSIGQ